MLVLHSQAQPLLCNGKGLVDLLYISSSSVFTEFQWAISGLQTANDIHKPPMILHTHIHTHGRSMNIISSYIAVASPTYLFTIIHKHLMNWSTVSPPDPSCHVAKGWVWLRETTLMYNIINVLLTNYVLYLGFVCHFSVYHWQLDWMHSSCMHLCLLILQICMLFH